MSISTIYIPPYMSPPYNTFTDVTNTAWATPGSGWSLPNYDAAAYNYDPFAATFFAFLGVAIALAFSNLGAAYGTAKAGIGIGSMAVTRPQLVYKSLIPIIMAGILGIYGLIVSVILIGKIPPASSIASSPDVFGPYQGFKFLASGMCCGFSSLASGYAIGIAGEAGVRGYAMNNSLFVGMILILIFAEAIGLYGLIVAIILSQG